MGEIVVVIVVKLFGLPVDGGVIGLVSTVHKELFLVLLPVEDVVDELLVLELILRNLLKAPLLEMGGLVTNDKGVWDSCDSGAA